MKINRHFRELKDSYLFASVAEKSSAYAKAHPDKKVIKMGIGDVTEPLCATVVEALKAASLEMGDKKTFRGYGPYEGFEFLREKISSYYAERGVKVEINEIFISDGAKSDIGNILDLFDADNTVLVPDPVYPVYVDTNIMAGRKILYCNATEDNGFLPLPDKKVKADIIYLCSPNNPTGAVYDKTGLEAWVNYAVENNALIIFDAAYEAFIEDKTLPRSIFEINGAEKCAIEFCSFSKTAGFTGTRCGYTVIPKALMFDGMSLNSMWLRRQSTKYNGTSYVIQRGAEAVFTEEGRRQIEKTIEYYKNNAKTIGKALDKVGIYYTGGINSPYIWLKCPGGMKSWDFFDFLLNKYQIVGTPGAGFGINGEGRFRLTAFNTYENTVEAVRRVLG